MNKRTLVLRSNLYVLTVKDLGMTNIDDIVIILPFVE